MRSWRFSLKILLITVLRFGLMPLFHAAPTNIAPSATTIERKPKVPPIPFCMVCDFFKACLRKYPPIQQSLMQ